MEIEARCPFCGEEEALRVRDLDISDNEAIEAWNRRAG